MPLKNSSLEISNYWFHTEIFIDQLDASPQASQTFVANLNSDVINVCLMYMSWYIIWFFWLYLYFLKILNFSSTHVLTSSIDVVLVLSIQQIRHDICNPMLCCMLYAVLCCAMIYDMIFMVDDTRWCDVMWYDIWYDMIWYMIYDLIWYDMIWYYMISHHMMSYHIISYHIW